MSRDVKQYWQELRAIENEDALGEKFARFKKSDDSTALLLEIA